MIKEERRKRGKQALKGLLILIVIPGLITIFWNWKIGVGLFVLVSLYKLFKIKRRGYFAKDTSGKEVGFKSFMKRWKEGASGITPLQQARTTLLGTWIIITGVIWGIVVTCMSGMWWLFAVLIGSLIVTGVQLLGSFQKFWRFKETDKIQKMIEAEMKKGFKEPEEAEEPEENIQVVKMERLQ